MTAPRLAFVGLGWIGRIRAEAIVQGGLAHVAALVDPDPEALAAAVPLAPEAPRLSDLAELRDVPLDGVVIATPSALHAPQAIASLQAGIPVFCQKPLGRDRHEARRIVETAQAADRLLGVDLSYRKVEALARVRREVAAGTIGDVYAVALTFHNAYGPDGSWAHDPALAGGGCLIDLGVHLIDAALWVLDLPGARATASRLFRKGAPLERREDGVEDYAAAQLELPSGAVASLACSWRLSAGRDAVIEASFYGTRGGLSFRNVDGSFYDFRAELYRGTSVELLVEPPDPWGGRTIADWVRGLVEGGGSYRPGVERAVDVAAVIDGIYDVASRRTPSSAKRAGGGASWT